MPSSHLLILDRSIGGLGVGDPNFAVQGTGIAFPTGIESPLEYNGLIMNVLNTIDKIRVMKIDGLADADVLDAREQNPSSDGETPLDAFYGGRTLTLTGRIEAYTLEKMRDLQQSLRMAFANVQTEYPLIFHTYGIDSFGHRVPSLRRTAQIFCRKVQPIAMTEEQVDQRFFREFMVTLRASNPRFTSYLPSIADYKVTVGVTSLTDTLIAQPENIGNFPSQPLIRLIGPLTNPILTNTRSGEFIKLVGTIPNADKWDINVRDKTILDQNGNSHFNLLTVDSDMFQLYAGVNPINLTASGLTGNSEVTINFTGAWI